MLKVHIFNHKKNCYSEEEYDVEEEEVETEENEL